MADATTEPISARDVESRHRLRIVLDGKERDCTVSAVSNVTFQGTLVARKLYLRADDKTNGSVDVNPDDVLNRIMEE